MNPGLRIFKAHFLSSAYYFTTHTYSDTQELTQPCEY